MGQNTSLSGRVKVVFFKKLCRSIPAAKFRHAAELNGATKAALNSPLSKLRTQRRSRRERAGARTDTIGFDTAHWIF
jgi:hypothetical protein